MDYRNMYATRSAEGTQTDAGLRKYMLSIYNYMASALALTGIVALVAASSPAIMGALYNIDPTTGAMMGMNPLGWLVMFAPLGFVFFLGFKIQSMSMQTAQLTFWAFASVMGLSMAHIFLAFTGESIARVFFITSAAFGGLSLYGYTTKKDLSGWGSFLTMGLIGLIIASVVNIFLASSALHFAISVIGVLIFAGLTAYDTQNLKRMYFQLRGQGEAMAKMSIMGALRLYLDFINMFMFMLQFFGERR